MRTSSSGAPGAGAGTGEVPYALRLADESHARYVKSAAKARRYYRLSETSLLFVAAAIPATAVIRPGHAEIPAVLGAVVVFLSGLRSLFHWPEDYTRYSQAREAVEAERRFYLTGAAPYDDPARRDAALAANVTRIEQQEMGAWVQVAARPADPSTPPPAAAPPPAA